MSPGKGAIGIWAFFFLACPGSAKLESDSTCKLFTFVPFTLNGTELPYFKGKRKGNLGFSHFASALLAMEHFNAKHSSVVSELDNDKFADCTFQFNTNSSRFFDTGYTGQSAAIQMQRSMLDDGPPCAVAGPYSNLPAKELSVLASATQIPIVVHRSINLELSRAEIYPFSTHVYAGAVAKSPAVVNLLQSMGRTDFVAILHAMSETQIHQQTTLVALMENLGIRTMSFGYIPIFANLDSEMDVYMKENSLAAKLAQLKDLGYRTIVVLSEPIELEQAIPTMAEEADKLGLTNGDYFWCFYGGLDLAFIADPEIQGNFQIKKLLRGAALVMPIENFLANPSDDKYLSAWRSPSKTYLERLEALNPIPEGMPGYKYGDKEYFANVDPEPGAGFLYDAVMSIGIGACLAQSQSELSGSSHLAGIRAANFTGASGQISFGDNPVIAPGTRRCETVTYGVFNLFPATGNDESTVGYTLTGLLKPARTDHNICLGFWTDVAEFIYADGSTTPPKLLRDEPNQNYLSTSYRAIGFALFSVAAALIVLSVAWIYKNREHRVLKAAQPSFLLVMCFGSMLINVTIVLNSFDESNGWSTQMLSRACASLPWFPVIGLIQVYGALFTKLWRVNRVLQFRRTKIDVSQVLLPLRLMAVMTLIILAIWTAISPIEWVREEVDDITGESFGRCQGENVAKWFTPIVVIMIISIALTLIMAWKTKDVDEAFSETWWIFALIFVQLQTLVVSTPLLVILQDVSTDGRYLGFTLMIWTFPMSTTMLIMLPKVLAFYKPDSGSQGGSQRRGSTGGVHVSGMNSASFSTYPPSENFTDHGRKFVVKEHNLPNDDTEPASVNDENHSPKGSQILPDETTLGCFSG